MKHLKWLGGGLFLLALAGYAVAQITRPTDIPGCVYNAVAPTLANGQTVVIQCDTNGRIIVH